MNHVGPLALGLITLLVADAAAAVVVHDVAMRDTITLHTRVYLPGDDQVTPRGVILVRTPYGATATAAAQIFNLLIPDHQFITDRGWAYVVQDARGTGQSQGGATLRFIDDAPDSEDTLAWIEEQPWSNGKVGIWGLSALAINGLLAIQTAAPSLQCVASIVGTGDIREAFYPGGAFREEMAVGWLPDNAGDGILEQFRAGEDSADLWADAVLSDAEIAASPEVKTLIVGGMYDVFGIGSAHTHERLVAHSANPDDHFFVMGPWTHGGVAPSRGADLAGAFQGQLKYPLGSFAFPGQPVDPGALAASFFAWCLNDAPKPNWATARVYNSVLLDQTELITNLRAKGNWTDTDAWPPTESVPTSLYLQDDGTLGGAADPAGVALQVLSDPANPVATHGGAVLFRTAERPDGPMDQRALLDEREDVLFFEAPPQVGTLNVIGDVHATIWAASSESDIDVHVKLVQRTPEGGVWLLVDGVRRGRFLDDPFAVTPLTRGEPRLFEVDLGPVAIGVRPGHQLGVIIQPSNSDRFDINPNVAEPMAAGPEPRVAALTIWTDAEHPSAIELPVFGESVPTTADAPSEHPDPPDPLLGQPPPDAGEGEGEGEPADAGSGEGEGEGEGETADAGSGAGEGEGEGEGEAPEGCGCEATRARPDASALAFALLAYGLVRRRRR